MADLRPPVGAQQAQRTDRPDLAGDAARPGAGVGQVPLHPGQLLPQAAKLVLRVGRAAPAKVLGQSLALGPERRGGPGRARGVRAALAREHLLDRLQAPAERGQALGEGLALGGLGLKAGLLLGDPPQLLGQRPLLRTARADVLLQARGLSLAGPAHQAKAPHSRPRGLGRGPLGADALEITRQEPASGAQPAQRVRRVGRAAGAKLGTSASRSARSQARGSSRGAGARSGAAAGVSGSRAGAGARAGEAGVPPAASRRSQARCLAWRALPALRRGPRGPLGLVRAHVDPQVDAVAASGHVGPLGPAARGRGQKVGAGHRRPLADVAGQGVAVVGVLEVVGGQADEPPVVGPQGERSRPSRWTPATVPRVPFRTSRPGAVVVAAADEAIANRPLPPVGDKALGAEEAGVIQRRARGPVERDDVASVVGQDEALGRIGERRPRPVPDQLGAGVLRAGERAEAAVRREQGERLVRVPLGQGVGHGALQGALLAAVLGERRRAQAIGQGGEAPRRRRWREAGPGRPRAPGARRARPPPRGARPGPGWAWWPPRRR